MRSLRTWILSLSVLIFSATLLSGCQYIQRPSKSGLQVMTNDVPSTVYLDGQYLDKTPYIGKDIKPGTYTLKIQPDDEKLSTHEATITLSKGMLTVVVWKPGDRPETSGGVIFEMSQLPNNQTSEFAVVSIPDGAIVTTDTQPKEFAPVTFDNLAAGQHEFNVALPSYETQEHTVNLVAGHKVTATVKLAKQLSSPETTKSASGSAQTPTNATSGARAASASANSANTTKTPAPAGTTPITIKPTGFKYNGKEVLRVREQPNTGSAEIGYATVGQTYTGLKQSNGWWQIQIDALQGWVNASYVAVGQN
jgi:hypothetical protein